MKTERNDAQFSAPRDPVQYSAKGLQRNTSVSRLLSGLGVLILTAWGQPALTAPSVTSSTRNPASVNGDTESTSTDIFTLGEPGPAGPATIVISSPNTGESATAVVQTCTAQNIPGYPYSGTLCGGAYTDGCTPGALYTCHGGPRFTINNCTLSTSCAVGCLTGNNSTPVTRNVTNPQASDACFSGQAPLTVAPGSLAGGGDVTLTATLTQSHSPYAIVNFNGLGGVVAQPCDVPILLQANANSVSRTLPTAVVASTTQTPLWTLISYTDASSQKTRNLVSVPTTLTLEPGGSVVMPPLASFTLTDPLGAPISTIPGGSNSFTYGTLDSQAPFGGLQVAVTTSPAGAFTTDGSFTINAACTSNSSAGLLVATTAATSDIAATVTATSGAGAPISLNVTVTPPPLKIQSVTLDPMSVTAGATSTATVTLNRAVNGNDPTATVSIRVSEGLLSGTQLATFPGCTGSPVCIGPATVAVGASTTTVTLSTFTVSAQDQVTVSASAPWSTDSASKNLTINPGCAPQTCVQLGFNCGTASDGCGGTLSCGSCTAPATCVNNVCTTCTPTTCAAQGKNCGTIPDGCGGTLTCGTCTAPQTCGGGGTPNVCGGGGGGSSDTGLRSPTANTADHDGDGNGFQSSPTNAYVSDGLLAVDTDSGSGSSTSCTDRSKDKHRFWNYGFTFPGGVSIRGIEVRLDAKVDSTSSSPKMCVQLSWDGGNSWTSTKSTPTLGTSTATYMLGGSTDTWGRSWTTSNLSNSNFRVRISDVSSSTSRDFSLDWVAVRVYYQ